MFAMSLASMCFQESRDVSTCSKLVTARNPAKENMENHSILKMSIGSIFETYYGDTTRIENEHAHIKKTSPSEFVETFKYLR